MASLKKVSIFYRNLVASLIIFSLLGLLCLSYIAFMHRKEYVSNLRQEKRYYLTIQKEKVRERVESEIRIIQYHVERVEEKILANLQKKSRNLITESNSPAQTHSVDLLIKKAKDLTKAGTLVSLISTQGEIIYNGEDPSQNGKNIYNLKDERGKYVTRAEIEIAQEGREGTVSSYWKKNLDTKSQVQKKITFVSPIPELSLYVTTYAYLNNYSQQVKHETLERLSSQKNSPEDSVFVLDYSGTLLAYPDRSLVGKNLSNMKDPSGIYIFHEILKAKETVFGHFSTYIWENSTAQKTGRKLTFSKCYDDWGWCIASGIYIDEYEQIISKAERRVKRNTIRMTTTLLSFFIIAFLLAALYFYQLSKHTRHEISMFISFFKKAATEHKKIDSNQLSLHELSSLAIYANMMIDEILEEKKELEKLSFTDQLTGILNRNKFKEIMEHEVNIFQRYKNPLSLLLLDIDNFKHINDKFGHPAGDKILVSLTNIIESEIRNIDFFFRWGGEEFLVILPHTTRRQAGIIAEKLRRNIAGHSFPHAKRVTVSIGVAAFTTLDDINSVIERADKALYTSKEDGRNKTTVL